MSNIMLTDMCNLRCPYCFASEFVGKKASEITMEDFKKALEFIADGKEKIDKFGLIGGEPLLHSRFAEILELLLADDRIQTVSIYTNGLLMHRYMDLLKNQKVHLLINYNPPEILGEENEKKLYQNLKQLYEVKKEDALHAIRLGINIYKPDFSYEYIIPVLQEFGFDNIRFSITVPNSSIASLQDAHAYYQSIKESFLKFYKRILSMGVLPMFDCNKIPVCLFSVEELEPIFYAFLKYPEIVMNERHFLLSEWSRCSPVIDIQTNLKAVRCFGLSKESEVSISDFKGLEELETYYDKRFDQKAFEIPYQVRCEKCSAREWKQCMGSCLSYRVKENEIACQKQKEDVWQRESLYERYLKCYLKDRTFRGITDEILNIEIFHAFVEKLQKETYSRTEIEPIYEKVVTYKKAMKQAKEDNKKHRMES